MLASQSKIFLVGMMGVGKTTIGKKLAKQLHYSFLDLDKAIEQYAKQSIAEIFDLKGELYFREIEQLVLKQTESRNHIIVATGGGTACFYDNIEWMNAQGKTIYLRATEAFILSRIIVHQHKRPLIADKTLEQLTLYISELLSIRKMYYEQSQQIVDIPFKKSLDLLQSVT